MLDWIKYLPISLGWMQRYEPLTPSGPYFHKLFSRKWNIGDSLFHFKAPISNSVFGSDRYRTRARSTSPGAVNLLDFSFSKFNSDLMPVEKWTFAGVYFTEWLFVGPWFSGTKAALTMSANVLAPANPNQFNTANFLHPSVFEASVSDYLDTRYGYRKSGRKPMYRGPLNWHIKPISNSISAAVFDIHKIDQSVENPELIRHVVFPISHNRLLNIAFDFGGTRINKDRINPAPLFELCDQIIESFHLKPGQSLENEWKAIKAAAPDIALSEQFGELQWPLKLIKEKNVRKEKPVQSTAERIKLPKANQ